jgi:hypothetical protein
VDERQRRMGLNETLFREVNERVKAVSEGFAEPAEMAEFVCECGDDSCAARIRLTLAEYERIRSSPIRFAIVHGHELPEVERVVEENERYTVVEKLRGGPAELAEAHDPRS